jgi:formyltetrahydrofolate deformylase
MKRFATISVIGRDRSGVVARITGFLFEKKANIEALEEKVTRGQFGMTLQASWRAGTCDEQSLRQGFNCLGRSLGMEITMRLTDPKRRQRFAIMVTRETHCYNAIMAAYRSRQIKADPVVVIGNHPDMEPLARKHHLPFEKVPWEQRGKAESDTLQLLEKYEIDFVVLARFMKILSPNFVWRYKNKIINIHPSLLPSFPGPQAYRQAYEQGVKIIGVSAHFVTMNLDEGPIIAQDCFHVRPSMALKEIIAEGQKLEARTLVKAVKLYLNKQLDVYWGTVREV